MFSFHQQYLNMTGSAGRGHDETVKQNVFDSTNRGAGEKMNCNPQRFSEKLPMCRELNMQRFFIKHLPLWSPTQTC